MTDEKKESAREREIKLVFAGICAVLSIVMMWQQAVQYDGIWTEAVYLIGAGIVSGFLGVKFMLRSPQNAK